MQPWQAQPVSEDAAGGTALIAGNSVVEAVMAVIPDPDSQSIPVRTPASREMIGSNAEQPRHQTVIRQLMSPKARTGRERCRRISMAD